MRNNITEVSTKELVVLINIADVSIVDVRTVDAYNGWRLNGEIRGGHIKGARSLPVKWASYIDWIEIVRSKNITAEKRVVVYGDSADDIEKVAELFLRAGYQNTLVYNHFMAEWVSNPELPMEYLERYRLLVNPLWVNELISGNKPSTYNSNRFVICHAHYRNQSDYDEGHIPGAVSLDTLRLESPETWNRRTPEELKETLLNMGITKDTTVVLYGRFSFPDNNDPFPGSSAGHLGAIRCAFIMLYAGVKDVRVLNGGIKSWEDEGYRITTRENKPLIEKDFGAAIPGRPELAVDIPEAKQLLKSENGDLVCVRSWEEFTGKVSGYNYIEKKGRIPGAIFGNCGSDAYHMENYRNLDHTTREYHEIAEIWKNAGIKPDNHNAFYCGTGWRGSEAFFNAYLMGWEKVSVFDGGWFEWSNNPNNPIETGDPVKLKI
jgi:thiosulfate/3-mercaptopyruvate sulfurtransferase